ncbi:hypothetical protein ACFQ34_24235 [Pseudonocardia benzenivorans]|uniref:Uncharacterized protein n=1 Tax=Pseudonocardia benzenivorans TaxID=228005 RepID=A0ABW3VMI6_9PSEU
MHDRDVDGPGADQVVLAVPVGLDVVEAQRGMSLREQRAHPGHLSANPNPSTPTRSTCGSAGGRSATVARSSTCASAARALTTKRSPAGVRATRRLVRANSRVPSSRSSCWMRRPNACAAM